MKIALPLLSALLAGAACSTTDPNPAPPNAWEVQVQRGAEVFVDSCAECHGETAQGTREAPALGGAGALPLDPRPDSERTTQFRTALDVGAFAMAHMPPDEVERAAMTEAQYWDVLAFALSANGVRREQPVGPHNAATIPLR